MTAIIVQISIAIATIGSAWGIAQYQIQEGRKLNAENLKINEENAGKNRVIYDIEEMTFEGGNKPQTEEIRKKLSSATYTILNVTVNPSVWSSRIITLGKIKP